MAGSAGVQPSSWWASTRTTRSASARMNNNYVTETPSVTQFTSVSNPLPPPLSMSAVTSSGATTQTNSQPDSTLIERVHPNLSFEDLKEHLSSTSQLPAKWTHSES